MFITGGVLSSLSKGLAAASVGASLKARPQEGKDGKKKRA
ncbi:MAG: hypothetical protein KBA80_07065 [Syntrophobacterales bacterium]|nr:hypothetical protein [Syntrophobacterales bacterium]